MHARADAHEIEVKLSGSREPLLSRWCSFNVTGLQAPAPPAGFVDVARRSSAPIAAQNRSVGHEIDENTAPGSALATRQPALDAAGLRELTTCPPSLVATHNATDSQEIELSASKPPIGSESTQADGLAAGALVVATVAFTAGARQEPSVSQTTAVNPLGSSFAVEVQPEAGPFGAVVALTSPAASTATQVADGVHARPRGIPSEISGSCPSST
jgi:hypothetical protein